MAITNQGIFKKILKRYDELNFKYKHITREYDKEMEIGDFVSNLAYLSYDLYNDLDELYNDVESLLHSTKFETIDKQQKYVEIRDITYAMKIEIRQLFRNRVNNIKNAMTDAERETITDLWF